MHDPSHSDREGLPVSPSLQPTLERAALPKLAPGVDFGVLRVSLLALLLGGMAVGAAEVLGALIALFTNIAFHGRFSTADASPLGHGLGLGVLAVPVVGGLLVGLMARFGSPAIRGHGIPEAMEQALHKGSRIPARMTFLKPLSAAVSIGTGGPFGAEGPIIATGGALGSLLGQVLRTTALERRALLAAGAAAGMAATFGTPVSAVVLALELLLFELRGRSLIPVTLATAAAACGRAILHGSAAVFRMPPCQAAGLPAFIGYVAVGACVGLAAVAVTRLVYGIEDAFERLPIHWMWWPAIGGLAVGFAGWLAPRTLGVGYDNIEHILSGDWAVGAVAVLCLVKLAAWALALGSGTSGGTLAPLLTLGAGVGFLLTGAASALLPAVGLDARMGALVGMAAMFGGASHAMLASAVFAFEATQVGAGVVPLLGGTAAAYLVSSLLLKRSIMTEKISRRGAPIPAGFGADFLEQVRVGQVAVRETITLRSEDLLAAARAWLASGAKGTSHQGFPVVDPAGRLVGVLTRRDLLDPSAGPEIKVGTLVKRAPAVVFDDSTLREAADHMVREKVGRLPVVTRAEPDRAIGILTRSDLLAAHQARLDEHERRTRSFRMPAGPKATEPAS